MSDFKELARRLRAWADGKRGITPASVRSAADAIEKLSAEVDRYRESDLSEAVQRLDETKDAEVERLSETVTRLQQTLEAYGDGGNEGPSMHAFLGDYQLVKEAIGGSYTAEAFEALTEKAKALDELEAWLRESPLRDANVGPNPDGMAMHGWSCELSEVGEYVAVVDHTTTLAGAIRDAIEKARGA